MTVDSTPSIRTRCTIAGVILAVSPLIPVVTQNDGALPLWRIAPDLGAESLLGLLAPALCGALVLVATRTARRTASLAVVVIAAVTGLFLVIARSGAALAGDLLPSQEPWRSEPLGALLAIAFTVAAVRAADRRAARVALIFATVCALAHLTLAPAGESPLAMVARVITHVASASGPRNLMGACMLSALVLWPALAVGAGAWHAAQPAARPRSLDALLAAYGLPAILGPLAQRSLADPWGGSASAVITLGSLMLLAAVLVLLASAIDALAEEGLGREGDTALLSLTFTALTVLGSSLLHHRPGDDPDWRRQMPRTPEGDRVFADLLPRWNDGSREARDALTPAARALNPTLGNAIAALVSETERGGLWERRWYRLIDRVNEASRAADLPYYLDPTGVISAGGDARWYRLDTYFIEDVRWFNTRERTLTTLLVRALVPQRPRPAALGLSRDVQPFAVVALDEIQAYRADLERLAAQDPPRCGEGPAADAATEAALQSCGAALARISSSLPFVLIGTTERHEIQHRIDGVAPPRSAWLDRRLAWYEPAARARVGRELSAYLAQMTESDRDSPRLTLLRLLRMALVVRRGVEHDVALLAFEALGGAPAETYQTLADRDNEALRQAARAAWKQVFGSDLVSEVPLNERMGRGRPPQR